MAEEDRLDPDKLWLWLDLETSDLDPLQLTVLEMAWTITRSNLVQLLPVQSRLCAFAAPNVEIVTPNSTLWYDVHPTVQTMHGESGLSEAHDYVRKHEVVSSVYAFDRLILDSLFECGWDGDTSVIFAGSGVAGFDRPVLRECRSVLPLVMHYRVADVSIAAEVLGVPVPKTPEAVVALLEEADPLPDGFAYTERGLDGKAVDGWLQVGDLKDQKLHRAGIDVGISLLLARSLRARLRAAI